jgi:hypothetical protein
MGPQPLFKLSGWQQAFDAQSGCAIGSYPI